MRNERKPAWTVEQVAAVKERLEQALEEDGFAPQKAHDIVFHVTDWIEDLLALHGVISEPEKRSNREIRAALVNLLVHVPPHLNAARYLYGLGEVEDVFDLGILAGESATEE